MKPSEAEAPERIWAVHDYVAGMTNILSGHIMLEPTEIAETTEYVRADLVEAAVERGFWAGRSCGGSKAEIDAALAALLKR